MSIEKLSLVSIVGPVEQFDDAVSDIVTGSDIHLENALNVLEGNKALKPFEDENPYIGVLEKLRSIISTHHLVRGTSVKDENSYSADDADTLIQKIRSEKKTLTEEIRALEDKKAHNDEIIEQLKPLLEINVNLEDLLSFKFTALRFGKLPKASYAKLEEYLQELEAFFFKGSEDKDYVWGVYFTPRTLAEKVDRIFSSLYFERTIISNEASGTPKDAIFKLESENDELTAKITKAKKKLEEIYESHKAEIFGMLSLLEEKETVYKYRKFGAFAKNSFYIIGWANKKTIADLNKKVERHKDISLVIEDAKDVENYVTPPTLLKNNAFFKPFEFFVKMYGLPSYNEIDPTPLVALSYILMFGIMFGDLGQGAVLAIGGFLLYKFKKIDLAAIISLAGVSSMIFGCVFGSVFGYEDIINLPFTVHPMENIMPVLLATVSLGCVIITIAMIYNIANGIKTKKYGKVFFEQNGLAGLVFYWAVIIGIVLLFIKGINPFTVVYNTIFIVIPLILVFAKEPLTRFIRKKRPYLTGTKGEFVLENFFELFEIILSFVTNTVSFVRVGAFALNHVGMMGVVFVFSKMASGGASIVVVILGNMLVMGLEGLIVGIQVLRLEFYEIFSRFFEGSGREFRSAKKINA